MPKRSRSGVVSRPGAGGGADQREGRQVEGDDPGARALADRDRQPPVLHRRVEGLLQGAVEAVDLVDEEDGARLERGEQRGDVALALERRAGGLHEGHLELGGDDLRQRGLAQAGRAGQQHVVERLAAGGRRLDGDLQLLAQRVLADELLERARAQRAVELVLVVERRRGCGCARGSTACSRAARWPAAPRRSRPRRPPAAPGPRRAGSRARAGRRGRCGAGRRRACTVIGAAEVVRHADLLAQLDHDPLGGALADAGHGLQAGDVAGRQRAPPARAGSRR